MVEKGNLRSLGQELYEITLPNGGRIRLAIRNGKLYVSFGDVCKLIGLRTPSSIISNDTEFYKLEIKTPWKNGNKGGKCPLKYIDINNAVKFVRDRLS